MAAKAKSVKTVQIIARYFVKATGFVVYAVRSSNGKETYCTTLDEQGKATGCSCPARKPCYHMAQLEAREAAREQAKEIATVGEAITAAVESMTAHVEAAAVAGDKSYAEVVGYTSDPRREVVTAIVANDVTRCRHCGKPSRSGLCYRCNQY